MIKFKMAHLDRGRNAKPNLNQTEGRRSYEQEGDRFTELGKVQGVGGDLSVHDPPL